MCSIDSPMVRLGHVLTFETSCESKELNFGDQESGEFAKTLLEKGNSLAIERVKSRIDSDARKSILPADIQTVAHETPPELFANRLTVVKFGDLSIKVNGIIIRIGMSATVCKGSKKSKIWVRVSQKNIAANIKQTSNTLDTLRALADIVCDELSTVYHECLQNFLVSTGNHEKYDIGTQHVFLLEAGDYASAKLFDTITTLRETANLFTVSDEGDWAPLSDLFEFAHSRLSPEMELEKISFADEVSDTDIEQISDFFNAESKAIMWEVTLGRHGLFAVDELTIDPKTRSPRTHMVGLCSSHGPAGKSDNTPSSSWLVSGNFAPQLGGAF